MSTLGPAQATGRGRAFAETQSHHSIAIGYSTHRRGDASNRKKVLADPTRGFLGGMRTAGTRVASGVDRHQWSSVQKRWSKNTPNNRHADHTPLGALRPPASLSQRVSKLPGSLPRIADTLIPRRRSHTESGVAARAVIGSHRSRFLATSGAFSGQPALLPELPGEEW
mgnify:CR=1 FL=1